MLQENWSKILKTVNSMRKTNKKNDGDEVV